MPSLKWIRPEGRPKVYSIFKKLTSIGRAGGNDIPIDDRSLAEYHAQIVFDGREFNLNEVDRDGEILINGKKKRRCKIQHADRLTLGGVELVFSAFDESVDRDAPEGDADASVAAELSGLRKLHELSMRLMQSRSMQEQLELLMDTVLEATHASKGFLVLLENGETKISVARHLAGRPLPEAEQLLSDSIVKKVLESRQPLIVSDAVNDTFFGASQSVMNLQLASVMCAPLIAQGQLLGLIYVGNDSVRGLFEESSLDVLTIFASQASLLLQNAMLLDQLRSDRDQLAEQLNERRFGDIVGTNPSLVEVFRKVEKVASTDISVLITGETGTGKELIAREIHRRSPRHAGPFVVVNCGAIPENLMESELFGHVRGAFTGAIATRQGKFQAAHGGTLFLDEIGEMPQPLQVKLLRALQEKVVVKVGDTKVERVDIRVVAATNRNLEDEIRKSTFREDLYYRLNVVNLHLPPLRERGDDVLILAKFFLAKYAEELNPKVKGFTPNALIAIRKYEWPGNIRQLENRIKKAIVLCDKTLVGPEDMDLFPEALQPIMTLTQAREDFQRRYILEVLERNNGNRTKTARDLGVDPRTIFRYLEGMPDAPEPGGPPTE
ncbi:sigma-54-dependent Fis family transcriptional regulator [Sandaracinus amylolyticus]|uniref:Response regulatory protein n=1 Tax=Sandaracinus amylolyticus TaxID=927083 RepID=A0A0F6W908_9BACT|nr:sigma-54-dependent Fis family transcriptional regulator [Sandaracinus amylolyticus]AKF10415.1 Response regulatory protein [Sandaracinus amylolyticus]